MSGCKLAFLVRGADATMCAGPDGLACASQLGAVGNEVTGYEVGPKCEADPMDKISAVVRANNDLFSVSSSVVSFLHML